MNKIKIFMGIPTTGTIVDSQSYFLRELAETYQDYVEFVYPKMCVRRMFHDFARNEIVREFLDTDCDLLWFLDSDITPNAHFLDLVVNEYDKWQVAGATYPVFMAMGDSKDLKVVFTVYTKNEAGQFQLCEAPRSGKRFVDGLATGCLLIKREVFSKLQEPYFEFKFKPDSREMSEGEDLGFCRKLSSLGIQFYTDFEFICRHQKSVDLLDVNNYAIAYSNAQVLKYDATVKEIVTQATQAAYDKGFRAALEELRIKVEAQHSSKLVKPTPTLWLPK